MALDIHALLPHPDALLFSRDEATMDGLVASLCQRCVMVEPIVVLPDHRIVDGCRRYEAWKAARAAGFDVALAWRYYDSKADGADVWDFMVAKNRQRRDPGPCPPDVLRRQLVEHPDFSDRLVTKLVHCRNGAAALMRAQLVSEGVLKESATRTNAGGQEQDVSSLRGNAGGKNGQAPAPPDGAGDAWEGTGDGTGSEEDAAVRRASQAARDMTGRELPRHLKDDFADELYGETTAALKKAVRAVRGDPTARYIAVKMMPEKKPLLGMMETAADLLDQYQPWAVCPVCDGAEQGCEYCRTNGWLTQFEYEEYLRHQKLEGK